MKNSELKVNYLDENTFWHITSKLNIESIQKNGLVPRDGKRNGKNTSAEDPVPRVFFSQGLEGVLAQANNLAFLINEFIKNIEKTDDGDNGKNVKEKMQEFLNNSVNNEIEKKENSNGGFIDIANFIKEDIFKNGINKNLNEHDLNKIIYNITKTIWENDVCLKANLQENVDYSWNDTNYSATGNQKRPMTKKNMHAFEGHTITSDKLEMITDENGKPRSTWDIFKEMALFYKREHPDKKYLPVEEWQSGYMNENGEIVCTGEINHEKDYLSMFIEIEKNEKIELRNIARGFAKEKEVALKKEDAKIANHREERRKQQEIFSEQEIGKSTINVDSNKKDKAKERYQRNMQERKIEGQEQNY